MIIAHLTDLHIPEEGDSPYDVDVRSRFIRVLEDLQGHKPDLMVLGGDLCYREGKESVYLWIREALERTRIPYLLLSGNHDDTELMARTFGLEKELKRGKYYYSRDFVGRRVLFLDTSDDSLSEEQTGYLQKELDTAGHGELLIFMHHPPVVSGVYYMDLKYPLLNSSQVGPLLAEADAGTSVFCGHYHVEKSVKMGNLTVFITPSVFVQIDQEAHQFTVDHRGYGWRKIRLEPDRMWTTVRYISEEKREEYR
jgi:3',5'-cyclic-AMP phosphodiesterase